MSRTGSPRLLWPLQAAVALVFALIVLAISGGIVWYNHVQLTALAEKEAAEDFHEMASAVRREVSVALVVAETFLDSTALTIDPDLPDDRLNPLLAALAGELVTGLPSAMGLFIGRSDGTLVEVQRLARARPAVLGSAPPAAVWGVMVIARGPGGSTTERWLALDEDGRELVRTEPQEVAFDLRARPWYGPALATRRTIVTPPYRFANAPEAGVTIARAVREGAGTVLGIDITLADLDAFLARNRQPPALEPVIFNRSGGLVAHPDGAALRRTAGREPDQAQAAALPAMGDLRSPILAAMGGAFARVGADHDGSFEVGDQRYFARFEPAGPALGDYVIGIAVPYEAILGSAEGIRRNLLLVSLAAVALALVLVWIAARALAAPLRLATANLGRITRLDFEAVRIAESRMSEVHDLGRALATLEIALQNFVRYVPFALVRGIVDRRFSPRLGGERQPLSILFSDIEGFTGIAEALDPEALTAQTSQYFSEVGRELLRSGATIDKYIGDSIMAFWNAPEPQPDHVDRACLGALRAARQVARFNEAAVAAGHRAMPTRFGLHTGEAVVGNVGSVDRMNYTALGHNVNLASRLEGLNKLHGTTILASEAVRDGAGPHFVFRFIDRAVPHGATDAMTLYELMGAHIEEEPDLAPPGGERAGR